MSADRYIDQHLQHALAGVELQPEASSFDKITRKMAKKKRRRFFILFLGVVCFVSSLSTLSIVCFKQSPKIKTADTQKPVSLTSKRRLIVAGEHANRFPKKNKTTATRSEILTNAAAGIVAVKKEGSVTNAELKKRNLMSKGKQVTVIDSLEGLDQEARAEVLVTKKNNNKVMADETGDTSTSRADNEIGFDKMETRLITHIDTGFYERTLKTSSKTEFIINKDSSEHKRRCRFLIGIHANPQLTANLFSENKQRHILYDNNASVPFSKLYLENRKKQNALKFDYAFGIKLGLNYNIKWELFLGIGFQRFTSIEKLYAYTPGAQSITGPSGLLYANIPPQSYYENGFKNTFTYLSSSLELNRIIRANPFLKLKIGVEFKMNTLLEADYIEVESFNTYSMDANRRNKVSKTVGMMVLNTGIIRKLNRKFELRVTPGIFCSFTSVFSKNYVIKQKPCGLQLEAMLVYRILHH